MLTTANRSTAWRIAFISTMTIASPLALSTPASADQGRIEINHYYSDEIATLTVNLASVSGSGGARSRISADARREAEAHMLDRARNGHLVDRAEVKIAQLPDPFENGKKINVAWDGVKSPTDVMYSQKELSGGRGFIRATGVQMGGGNAKDLPSVRTRTPKVAGGYEAITEHKNVYLQNNGCATALFTAKFSDTKHKLNTCYELWGIDKTPIWFYNRWSLWTPANKYYETLDMEVSSRPWKGQEWKIKQLADWAPRAPHSDCRVNNVTLSGTYTNPTGNAVTGSVTVPFHNCQDYWLNVTPGIGQENRMTIDFDGVKTGQMYMDIAGKYDAIDETVLPYWADRNYMQVRFCTLDCINEYWAQADSGW